MAKGVIRVLYKLPRCAPMECAVANTLETMQALVGGYIETVTLTEDLVLICNEEGLIKALPFCCEVCGLRLYGAVILAGVQGDEFVDVPLEYNRAMELFAGLWR